MSDFGFKIGVEGEGDAFKHFYCYQLLYCNARK